MFAAIYRAGASFGHAQSSSGARDGVPHKPGWNEVADLWNSVHPDLKFADAHAQADKLRTIDAATLYKVQEAISSTKEVRTFLAWMSKAGPSVVFDIFRLEN